jgi:hypothetical protein
MHGTLAALDILAQEQKLGTLESLEVQFGVDAPFEPAGVEFAVEAGIEPRFEVAFELEVVQVRRQSLAPRPQFQHSLLGLAEYDAPAKACTKFRQGSAGRGETLSSPTRPWILSFQATWPP